MVLEFYYDLQSQPSRALYIFMKANNVKFESRLTLLGGGKTKIKVMYTFLKRSCWCCFLTEFCIRFLLKRHTSEPGMSVRSEDETYNVNVHE